MKVIVKVGDRVFEVDVENTSARPIIATVEGEKFEVWPENTTQTPAETATTPVQMEPPKQTGPASMNLSRKTMTSPLPGTVIEVFVKAGEYVEAGHVLMVIEAMKMKNSIRAVRAGKISAVLVNAGETVSHKQPLVEFSD